VESLEDKAEKLGAYAGPSGVTAASSARRKANEAVQKLGVREFMPTFQKTNTIASFSSSPFTDFHGPVK